MHVHSSISPDGADSLESVAKSAISKGLNGFCLTDHLDLFDTKVVGKAESLHSYERWLASYDEIKKVRSQWGQDIEILHGMELSEPQWDPERARQIIQSNAVDFVLGSSHAVEGYTDFCLITFPDAAFCQNLMGLYFDENIRLAKLGLMDSIAHVGYPQRYMSWQGFSINLMDYEEQLRALFTIMVQTGQGLEVNTSGLRQGTGCTFPNLPALKLYKELGGEIVTIGSDSHNAEHVGSHLKEAEALLKDAGFKYSAFFRERKAHFTLLP